MRSDLLLLGEERAVRLQLSLMAKGEERESPTHASQQEMAQQQPLSIPSRGDSSAPSSPYIYSMPACVLEDFCQKMDCLSDYDWMRFGERSRLMARGAAGKERIRGSWGTGGDGKRPP